MKLKRMEELRTPRGRKLIAARSCSVEPVFGIIKQAMGFRRFLQRGTAQSYTIDWYKIAGGGGTSTNGSYSVSGTIGQPDASGAMTGGSYSITGGFWSLISLVQSAGLPNLTITQSGNNVVVSWPNTGSYTLQQNSNLAASANWATSGYSISTSNGTNSITITSPTGNLFFRLANP